MLKKGRTYHARYFHDHRTRLTKYILPEFGPLLVSAITTKMIDEWLMDLRGYRAGEPLAVETKHKILVAFRKILGEAKYQGIVAANQAAEVDLFADNRPGREPFTIEELHWLFPEDMDALVGIWQTIMWATYFYIMASCGLRPSEVSALFWGDWNRAFHGAVIHKSVECRKGKIKELKTAKQGLAMKPAVFTPWAEQLLLMLESQTDDTSPHALIFQLGRGLPLNMDNANKHFKASCRRVGIEIRGRTQYCLRHSFNTHLLKLASVKKVQNLMGHLSLQSSARYDHPTGEDLLEQALSMRDIISEVYDPGGQDG